jgi:hypothetical protein
MPERPPTDPADHAEDFSRRYEEPLDWHGGLLMEEVGIPSDRIGARDIRYGVWRNFFPGEREGGGLAPGGRISLDSGIFNPERMAHLGPEASRAWARASVKDRAKARIAHEDMEYRTGTHEGAVEYAPETDLRIGGRARALLRAIRLGEQSIRRGGASPSR